MEICDGCGIPMSVFWNVPVTRRPSSVPSLLNCTISPLLLPRHSSSGPSVTTMRRRNGRFGVELFFSAAIIPPQAGSLRRAFPSDRRA